MDEFNHNRPRRDEIKWAIYAVSLTSLFACFAFPQALTEGVVETLQAGATVVASLIALLAVADWKDQRRADAQQKIAKQTLMPAQDFCRHLRAAIRNESGLSTSDDLLCFDYSDGQMDPDDVTREVMVTLDAMAVRVRRDRHLVKLYLSSAEDRLVGELLTGYEATHKVLREGLLLPQHREHGGPPEGWGAWREKLNALEPICQRLESALGAAIQRYVLLLDY